MNNRHQQYYQKIHDLVLAHLTPVLVKRLEAQMQLVNQVRDNLTDYYAHMDHEESKVQILEMVRKIKRRKESLAETVNNMVLVSGKDELDEEFGEYFDELQAYADTLPESLLEDQSFDRFQRFPKDRFKVKIGKTFKRWGLYLGWLPEKLANWVRSKTKKQVKPLKMWKHEVPLRGLIIFHFRDLLVEQLVEMVQTINRSLAASTYELYELETSMDHKFAGLLGNEESAPIQVATNNHDETIERILARIQELSESISGITANRLERIFEMFQTNYEMVGTIELSVQNFEPNGLNSSHRHAQKTYKKTMNGWGNTLAVLSDRYNFDQELFNARFTNIEQYLFLSQKLETRINDKVLVEIQKISTFLEAKQEQLSSASISDSDFKKLLNTVRYENTRFMKQAVPECIQVIRDQKIPNLLSNLVNKTKDEISKLSETRSMVKNISYEHAIKDSEINKIAPRDLITFEALPEYLEAIDALYEEVSSTIELTQHQLMEISNISDFNLETALAAIDSEDQHDRARSMSKEGIERAHSRLQDIVDDLKSLCPKVESTIHQGVDDFNSRIISLNEIDKVFDTQVRIAKAKAVEKTKALRQHYLAKLREFIPRLITNVRRRGLILYKRYRETSQRYGIGNPTQTLSAEVAGFLSETEATVKQLPFVYQRLFEISPLDNVYFYEPRPRANLALKKAFENWESGHYGATSLIAESGAGATTLIHFFLNDLKPNLPIYQLSSDAQIHTPTEFYDFFKEQFGVEGFNSTDELVEYLNNLNGKRIIILEDFEHFFLRKVNGFECIKIYIELLTRTNQNIFWITSINKYCHEYLNKTTDLDDIFSYNIELKPLKSEQITSLVLKRHRVSGFSLIFRPHKIDRKNNRFKKMTDEQRQVYLQKEYFNALNQIVMGNSSLALVYWLRSILEIEGDVMYIRSLKGVDTSFLLKLSEEKLFTLHSMLLHDGISIADHASVFSQPQEVSKLTILPLYDDGVAVYNNGRFNINPLLFRQVVTLLSQKNIIH